VRNSIRQFIELVSQTIPMAEPIYEFGALQLPGFEDAANLRPLFSGKVFIGCDMREGPGVDKVLNLHNIDEPAGSVGTVIALDTLEHVEFPHRALEEIHRILKPDGMVVVSSVLNFRIHSAPSDFWRFTPDGMRSVLRPFASAFVGYAGADKFPHTLVGIGFKGTPCPLEQFEERFAVWAEHWKNQTGRSWKDVADLFVPPILKGLDKRISRLLKRI
jgi:SAM-dependent methyltransferase